MIVLFHHPQRGRDVYSPELPDGEQLRRGHHQHQHRSLDHQEYADELLHQVADHLGPGFDALHGGYARQPEQLSLGQAGVTAGRWLAPQTTLAVPSRPIRPAGLMSMWT